MTTDRTVALVRQAIFHVLDGPNTRTPGLAWDFNDDEQRVDFADQVVTWLVTHTSQSQSQAKDDAGSHVLHTDEKQDESRRRAALEAIGLECDRIDGLCPHPAKCADKKGCR